MAQTGESMFESPLFGVMNKARALGYNLPPASQPDSSSIVAKLAELNTFRREVASLSSELGLLERTIDDKDSTILESIIKMDEELSLSLAHLQKLLGQKELLSAYLQQPFAGEHIVVEVGEQRSVLSLIKKMTETINSVPRVVETLEWAARVKFDDGSMEKRLMGLSGLLARCQRFHDALNDLRAALGSLKDK